jgi:hypothetical protein
MTIAEKGITALKTCHNEHSAKIHTNDEDINDLFEYLKEAKEHTHDNDKYIDRITDILSEHTSKLRLTKHRSHDLAKKYAEIGILRRRVSKCEEFNTEFAECFEAPLQLRGVISQMSDKVDECDRTITYMIKYSGEIDGGCSKLNNTIPEYSTFCEGYAESSTSEIAASTLDDYFSNYVDTEHINPATPIRDEVDDVLITATSAAESDDEFVEL